jgi:small subunit ribosomal protein S18
MDKKNHAPKAGQQSLTSINVARIDYKDVTILKKFTNPYGRITARKRTGISAKHQTVIAAAIKRARYMGLMPYVAR